MKKALLFGASGFIGSYLLNDLLQNPDYEKVTIVARKDLGIHHPKLVTLLGDYHSFSSLKEKIVADDVFITLGTTQKKTPDRTEYYQVDHDYPVLGAQIAKEKGATAVFIVTAIGANPNSNVFYVKTKGEAERDIIALGYDYTHIFRPSFIMGNRQEKRSMERALLTVWKVINPLFVGGLNKYKGITAEKIAKAMNNAARTHPTGVKIYHWKEMIDIQ
ncbi:MAG: NAD(P)H-binding protein [Bacteroides sp.]|nr:NAD(P)H-binding protein [Bacteroides sp.]